MQIQRPQPPPASPLAPTPPLARSGTLEDIAAAQWPSRILTDPYSWAQASIRRYDEAKKTTAGDKRPANIAARLGVDVGRLEAAREDRLSGLQSGLGLLGQATTLLVPQPAARKKPTKKQQRLERQAKQQELQRLERQQLPVPSLNPNSRTSSSTREHVSGTEFGSLD